MRLALLPLLALFLTSCGEEAPLTFDSPQAAMEAGDAALTARDTKAAIAAFSSAAEGFLVDCEAGWKAHARLCEAHLLAGDSKGAESLLGAILAPNSSANSIGLRRLGDAMVLAGEASLADKLMTAAVARFPKDKEAFSRIADGLEALKSGDAQALAALGYAGD